ncbi:hypothetical protein M5K25_024631 [Dendrobium thyrsiflorum]|uniref:Protein FAR1-RELATED SEQUENCE n=1 Tax=Dendrobium thyrsiflorum TaxID=117978 RepID=A0ABD0U2I6_DENTH
MKCSEEISPNIEIEERMKCSEEIDIEDRGNDFQKSEVNFTGTAEGFNISVAYKDEKEAYEAYCSYAHNNGFSVRCGGMSIDFVSNDSSKFLVNHTENKDQSNPWVVHFDATDCTIQCTCKKFETMGLLCCHSMRVLRQLDIVKIPEKYLMLRWSAKARKSFYSGYGCLEKGTDSGSGFIFRNHISRFAYQISTRAQWNELAEQYMLGAMKDTAENINLLVEGKMTNSNFIAKSKSRAAPVSAFKDPQKRRPKGISNARLKGYWEKKKQKKRPVLNAKNISDKGKDIPPSDVYFPSMPECFAEEFINRRKTREEGGSYTPYTRMMMDSFTSELEF